MATFTRDMTTRRTTFYVHVPAHVVLVYEVEAETPQEAARLVGDGEANIYDQVDLERELDRHYWWVEDSGGKTVINSVELD